MHYLSQLEGSLFLDFNLSYHACYEDIFAPSYAMQCLSGYAYAR